MCVMCVCVTVSSGHTLRTRSAQPATKKEVPSEAADSYSICGCDELHQALDLNTRMNAECNSASWGWHPALKAPCPHRVAAKGWAKKPARHTNHKLDSGVQLKRPGCARVFSAASYPAATVSSKALRQLPTEQLEQVHSQEEDLSGSKDVAGKDVAGRPRQVKSRRAGHSAAPASAGLPDHEEGGSRAQEGGRMLRSAAQLTMDIKACRTWQQVQQLYQQHGSHFDFMHIAACVTHLAQLSIRAGHSAQTSVGIPTFSTSNMDMQGSSSSSPPSGPAHAQLCAHPCSNLLHQLITQLEPLSAQLRGREAANIAWAVAKLGGDPHHPYAQQCMARCWSRVRQMNAQELTNTLYASALLGLPPSQPQQARELIEVLPSIIPQCSPHAISNMVWALGRLRHHQLWLPAMVVRRLLSGSYTHMYAMTPQGLVMLAYGLLQLGVAMPNTWRKRLMDASWRLLPGHQHVPVTASVQGSNTTVLDSQTSQQQQRQQQMHMEGLQIPQAHQQQQQQQYGEAAYSRLTGNETGKWADKGTGKVGGQGIDTAGWSSAGLVQLMWAVVRSHTDLGSLRSGPPRAWLMACLKQVQHQLDSLPPQEAAQLLWLLAKLQIRPPLSFLEQLLTTLSGDLQAVSPEGLAGLAWSLARLHVRPSKQLAEQLLRTTYARREQLPTRSASTFLISLPPLGLRPNLKFVQGLIGSWQGRLGAQGTWLDLLQLSAGLPALPHKPPAWLLEELLQLLQRHGKGMKPRQLQTVLQGLQQLDAPQDVLQPYYDQLVNLHAHASVNTASDAHQTVQAQSSADSPTYADFDAQAQACVGSVTGASQPVETQTSATIACDVKQTEPLNT